MLTTGQTGSDDEGLWVLELDTIPGLIERSRLPQAAATAGDGFDELIERILDAGVTR